MIDLPPAFASHLQADATTLTYCFLVEKKKRRIHPGHDA